jgi:hypothetical protein
MSNPGIRAFKYTITINIEKV